jgi:hypothetical protein
LLRCRSFGGRGDENTDGRVHGNVNQLADVLDILLQEPNITLKQRNEPLCNGAIKHLNDPHSFGAGKPAEVARGARAVGAPSHRRRCCCCC